MPEKDVEKLIACLDVRVDSGQSRVWIFQANPDRFDVLKAVSCEELDEDVWLVTRYQKQIHAGDVGLIWMAGKGGGIYAVVDIISNPELMVDPEASTTFWRFYKDRGRSRLRVRYKYVLRLFRNHIPREELEDITELENMAIFVQPRGTNFPVSKNEWKIISGLMRSKFNLK